jgi:hypothetical protein
MKNDTYHSTNFVQTVEAKLHKRLLINGYTVGDYYNFLLTTLGQAMKEVASLERRLQAAKRLLLRKVPKAGSVKKDIKYLPPSNKRRRICKNGYCKIK